MPIGNENDIQLVQGLINEADIVLFNGGVLGTGVRELGKRREKGLNSGASDFSELTRQDSFAPAGAYGRGENDLFVRVPGVISYGARDNKIRPREPLKFISIPWWIRRQVERERRQKAEKREEGSQWRVGRTPDRNGDDGSMPGRPNQPTAPLLSTPPGPCSALSPRLPEKHFAACNHQPLHLPSFLPCPRLTTPFTGRESTLSTPSSPFRFFGYSPPCHLLEYALFRLRPFSGRHSRPNGSDPERAETSRASSNQPPYSTPSMK